MIRLACAGLLAGFVLTAAWAAETPDPKEAAAKEALQEVGDFVGDWKGSGEGKVDGKNQFWKETLSWGWKFKDGRAWLALEAKDGKEFTGGKLTYAPDRKVYRLTTTDKAGKEQVYEGKLTRGKLVLNGTDKATGDVHRLTIYTLADGARMIVQTEVQSKGRGLFSTTAKVAASKEGVSFAGGGGKKPECVVTGGLGTRQVSYMGKTYYVCCSGCADEFNADPKKYVEEYEKKKKK
jgi:hypothetical protein